MVSSEYMRMVGELLIVLLVLYIAMGDKGIISNSVMFIMQIEPITMQNFLISALNVGAAAPGDFVATYNTAGKPHKIVVSTEDDVKYVNVEPARTVNLTTKYVSHGRAELTIGNCILIDQPILLKTKPQVLTVTKVTKGDKCILGIEAS